MSSTDRLQPLAARARPKVLADVVGQTHLVGPGGPLHLAWELQALHSMFLWGPPGSGKTTLAKMLASHAKARFESLSAVMAGVKDVRAVVERAELAQRSLQQKTVLFIDEIHRFNKAQQDALLPFVEDGTLTLIGATTENPSFAINNALLSRARVYILKRLDDTELQQLLVRITRQPETYFDLSVLPEISDAQLLQIAQAADGDARAALNLLDIILNKAMAESLTLISDQLLVQTLSESVRHFDKHGDHFYNLISALHKSVRGSDPDAALYWLARMLDAGCDPLYIARRVLRMASEDIGNADPRALSVAQDAFTVQTQLGSPEGELALAQAVLYCACAAKSNAVYTAFSAAMAAVKKGGSLPMPLHLCNAQTTLMKAQGYAKDYRYAHDFPHAYVPNEQYFPDNFKQTFYYPSDRGLESKIKAKLTWLKELNRNAAKDPVC